MARSSSPPKRSHESDSENENETAQRPSKRPRCNYSDTIAVLVGPEQQSFTVHKDVICNRSTFFRAACSTRWKEGQEKIVRLLAVKPSVFEMYMDWVYFGEVASNVTRWLTDRLTDLYLLGDVVDDKGLRNKVMATLQDHVYKANNGPGSSLICRICENTAEGSTLRKWAIDVPLLRSQKYFANRVSEYPSDFVQQIAVELMQQTSDIGSATFLARSQYQEVDGEEA